MQIEKVCEPIITVRRSQYPDDNLPEFLLVGRSNVGKSSLPQENPCWDCAGSVCRFRSGEDINADFGG